VEVRRGMVATFASSTYAADVFDA